MSVFEAIMLVCFGASWPAAINKTLRSKNPAGKSLLFLCLIITGYLCGVIHKCLQPKIDWVVWLYAVNLLMVATDLFLVCKYRRDIRNRESAAAAKNDL